MAQTVGSIEFELPVGMLLDEQGKQKATLNAPIYTIGDLKWRLELRRRNENQQKQGNYDVLVHCNDKCREHFWFCTGDLTLSFKMNSAKEKKLKDIECIYMYNGYNFVNIAAVDISKNHTYLFKLGLNLSRVRSKMFALDTNIEIKLAKNRTKLIPVNKHGLAGLSNFFRNFFFEQWVEKGKEEFVIHEEGEDFDIDAFKLMLYAALASGWMVNDLLDLFDIGPRIIEILRLSVKYDIPPLIQHCEKQLITRKNAFVSYLDLLEIADQLNLPQLKEHALAKVDPIEFMKDITQSIEIRSRLGKRTIEQLDHKISGCSERIRYAKNKKRKMDGLEKLQLQLNLPQVEEEEEDDDDDENEDEDEEEGEDNSDEDQSDSGEEIEGEENSLEYSSDDEVEEGESDEEE